MNREEKAAAIEEIAERLDSAEAVFAVDYRGISVTQAAELRGELRQVDASFRVTKNRLTKLAAAKAGQQDLDQFLTGPTALTFVSGDAASAAKALTTFAGKHDVLSFKGGLLGAEVLDADAFNSIAKLPSREALEAQLAGVVASPIVGLVRGLGSMVSGLAIALQQIADQGLVGGDAPPAESGDDEAPAATGDDGAAAENGTDEELPKNTDADEEQE